MSKKPLTVMLIDDDPINNLVNRKILSKHNSDMEFIEHLSAYKALEALRDATNPKPDIILLDINMPEMDGWEFLDKYRSLRLNIRLFMLTSSIAQEDIDKSKSYREIQAFITKPLDKNKVERIFP